jgi:hypothetical protein
MGLDGAFVESEKIVFPDAVGIGLQELVSRRARPHPTQADALPSRV